MLFPFLLLVAFINAQTTNAQGFVESLLSFMNEGLTDYGEEPKNRENILQEYDFIIVGAGTAGCVLAHRLSENPNWKILLIEAGTAENIIMDVPLFANILQLTNVNWKYKTMPQKKSCLGFQNKQCHWPRGKVMGGSSVLNYMIYTRGNYRDYDNWEKMGNPGWGFKDVMKYFKRIENYQVPGPFNETYHSRDGMVTVSETKWKSAAAQAFMEAGRETGQPIVDYNGATQTGFSYLQVSIDNGIRASASRAYLHPIRDRPNLHVRKGSMVTKIIIDPNTKVARGITFMSKGKQQQVYAKKEVLLSAGAINTPQLLMLSGIGPRDHLNSFDIPVLSDLKVGYNLMDHIATGGLMFTVNTNATINSDRIFDNPKYVQDYFQHHEGPIATAGGCEALAFYDTTRPGDPNGHPDIELLYVGGGINSYELIPKYMGIDPKLTKYMYDDLGDTNSFMIFPMLMLPKSRGRILLKSKNPFEHPAIFPNYLAYKEDMRRLVKGVKITIDLMNTTKYREMDAKVYSRPIPACAKHKFGTDAYWGCHSRHLTLTIYHYSGTAKMGPESDKTAVVSPRLNVYGIKNLRVVDASIIPSIPSAHTNAPVFMIAEKAADMIKEDWSGQ